MVLFALNSSRDFGEQVSARLGIPLSRHEEREFEDGEHKARSLENVRGKDVFVIQSLHGDSTQSVNDKFCRLLFFIGSLRDASAGRVTAVVPYLCYARKDRKTKSRDPVTTRYVAALFEAVGVDAAVTLDVHNLAAWQNAWRTPTDHLEARKLFVDYFVPLVGGHDVVVVSPDAGTTLVRAAAACRLRGAPFVHAAASHGVFNRQASEILSSPAIDRIVITNTIPPFRLNPDLVHSKVIVLDVSALFAEAIRRIHSGGSVVELLET
jgi:ribose-phosphate pyrophosphokinase